MVRNIQFVVRSGEGTVAPDTSFTDVVDKAARIICHHPGWQSVRYKGKRYRLGGGIRTDFFICLNNPIDKV